MTNLFFDLIMVALLLAAIIFCYRLNTRLKVMREMGAELSPFMKNMSNYLGQISQSIDKLKQVADLGNQGLNENIPMAINLKDDFDLLLEHSDKMARRLDEVIDKAREIDQRLQQTMRIVESARSQDHRVDLAIQKTTERPKHNTTYQEPFSKDKFNKESFPSSLDKNELDKDAQDYFVPNQSKRRDTNQFISKQEYEVNKKHSPLEDGIMAKLRGLR